MIILLLVVIYFIGVAVIIIRDKKYRFLGYYNPDKLQYISLVQPQFTKAGYLLVLPVIVFLNFLVLYTEIVNKILLFIIFWGFWFFIFYSTLFLAIFFKDAGWDDIPVHNYKF